MSINILGLEQREGAEEKVETQGSFGATVPLNRPFKAEAVQGLQRSSQTVERTG